MILSKQNLLVSKVAKYDKDIPVLDNVLCLADGTTVAGSRETIIAVSPVHDEIRKSFPVDETPGDTYLLPADTVTETLKAMPHDSKFGGVLEHTDITGSDDGEVVIRLHDGKRAKKITARVNPDKYIPWREILSKSVNSEVKAITAIEINTIINLLGVVKDIAAGGGKRDIIYISFNDNGDLTLQGMNRKTHQRVLAVVKAYTINEEDMPQLTAWERGLTAVKKQIKKIKKLKKVIRRIKK